MTHGNVALPSGIPSVEAIQRQISCIAIHATFAQGESVVRRFLKAEKRGRAGGNRWENRSRARLTPGTH